MPAAAPPGQITVVQATTAQFMVLDIEFIHMSHAHAHVHVHVHVCMHMYMHVVSGPPTRSRRAEWGIVGVQRGWCGASVHERVCLGCLGSAFLTAAATRSVAGCCVLACYV